jgi:hypothetical protein
VSRLAGLRSKILHGFASESERFELRRRSLEHSESLRGNAEVEKALRASRTTPLRQISGFYGIFIAREWVYIVLQTLILLVGSQESSSTESELRD